MTQRLVRQFRITKQELIIGGMFVAILFFWSWFGAFRADSSSITQLESLIEGKISEYFERLSDLIQSSLAATDLVTAGAWSIIGLIIYLIVWTLQTLVMGTRQSAVFTFAAVHPEGFNIGRYIVFSVIEKVAFVCMVVASLSVGIAWAQKVLPGAASLYISAINTWSLETILRALLATVGVLLCLHVLIVLLRFMTGRYLKIS